MTRIVSRVVPDEPEKGMTGSEVRGFGSRNLGFEETNIGNKAAPLGQATDKYAQFGPQSVGNRGMAFRA